jgi:hypothetical protein
VQNDPLRHFQNIPQRRITQNLVTDKPSIIGYLFQILMMIIHDGIGLD